jgi:hypothetical protein
LGLTALNYLVFARIVGLVIQQKKKKCFAIFVPIENGHLTLASPNAVRRFLPSTILFLVCNMHKDV